MKKTGPRFRSPTEEEQQVLDGLQVRLVSPEERARFDALLLEHHYLHSATAVGEQLRYVATFAGQWLGLALWAAPALHLRGRDGYIGWSEEQRRTRLPLLANNTRLLILPECHYPNLVSRFMKQMLGRLSADWQERWHHPLALVETFVDPQRFTGTVYQVSGWTKLGVTAGWGRTGEGQDYYLAHGHPKQLWVRELARGALGQLRAPALPAAWAVVEEQAAPRCRASVPELRSLLEHVRAVPEFRRRQSLAYPLAGMLALIAVASFCGVVRGQRDLAAFARTLSQGQLRALAFRLDRKTRRVRCPDETTFHRVLTQVAVAELERALLAWQEQVLGPAPDTAIIVDGKKLRHAQGVELVSAIGAESGRWLGTVCSEKKSNEIPAARALLEKVDLAGKTILADALHTQVETAPQILYEHGGDDVFTVKDNQKTLRQTLSELLQPQPFSPCAHAADTAPASASTTAAGVRSARSRARRRRRSRPAFPAHSRSRGCAAACGAPGRRAPRRSTSSAAARWPSCRRRNSPPASGATGRSKARSITVWTKSSRRIAAGCARPAPPMSSGCSDG
jgi:predicted transposase YbfD/YdcC